MSFYCIRCKNTIPEDEYKYSFRHFGKPLCRAHQPTPEARKLGHLLAELGNWNVEYEKFDHFKHVDIAIPGAKVYIEVDGLQHITTADQALRDLKRTYYSYKKSGYITLHVPNILVRNDAIIHEAAHFINEFLEENYNDIQDSFIVRIIKKIFA